MNKKDYDEIAKIIREERNFIDNHNKIDMTQAKNTLGRLTKELADYFEKEDIQISGTVEEMNKYKQFYRGDFLKKSGVQESQDAQELNKHFEVTE